MTTTAITNTEFAFASFWILPPESLITRRTQNPYSSDGCHWGAGLFASGNCFSYCSSIPMRLIISHERPPRACYAQTGYNVLLDSPADSLEEYY